MKHDASTHATAAQSPAGDPDTTARWDPARSHRRRPALVLAALAALVVAALIAAPIGALAASDAHRGGGHGGSRGYDSSGDYGDYGWSGGYDSSGGYGWSGASGSGRWIDVDLSNQWLTAYEGDTPVFGSAVSTGIDGYDTPTGDYEILWMLDYETMVGDDYYLPDVPYVMYFAPRLAIHGTYWHDNFGTPMSHGCVNLPTDAAAWLYDWVSIGTPVMIHY